AQRARLAKNVGDEIAALREIARRALTAPTEPRAALQSLTRSIGDPEHRAVMVLRGGTLRSWAGTLHADPAALTGPVGVVATPFGLTLHVSADSGSVRAIAASLLYAASPADHMTRGLAQRLG